MFILMDGEKGWNANITSSSTNALSIAKAILKSAKKKES